MNPQDYTEYEKGVAKMGRRRERVRYGGRRRSEAPGWLDGRVEEGWERYMAMSVER